MMANSAAAENKPLAERPVMGKPNGEASSRPSAAIGKNHSETKDSKMADDRNDRVRAVDLAMSQIEKQFGKGSIMRLGTKEVLPISVISTGSISFDAALGAGGFPRGRVVEIF